MLGRVEDNWVDIPRSGWVRGGGGYILYSLVIKYKEYKLNMYSLSSIILLNFYLLVRFANHGLYCISFYPFRDLISSENSKEKIMSLCKQLFCILFPMDLPNISGYFYVLGIISVLIQVIHLILQFFIL